MEERERELAWQTGKGKSTKMARHRGKDLSNESVVDIFYNFLVVIYHCSQLAWWRAVYSQRHKCRYRYRLLLPERCRYTRTVSVCACVSVPVSVSVSVCYDSNLQRHFVQSPFNFNALSSKREQITRNRLDIA